MLKNKKRLISIILCVLVFVFAGTLIHAENNSKESVIVGGSLFGVKMSTDGVVIVGIDTVETDSGNFSPAYEAGLKLKDIIKNISGTAVNTAEQVVKKVSESGGNPLEFTVLRNAEEKKITLTPVKDKSGAYKGGFWVRNSAAGLGTLTYIKEDTLEFGGLGHGICDGETTMLLPLLRGVVTEVELNGIIKGRSQVPGEIKGSFKGSKIGALTKNTNTGVYGAFTKVPEGLSQKMEIGKSSDVVEGNALLRSSVSGQLRDYNVIISKVNSKLDGGKNFIVEITDPELLQTTGGIVQGMSGSPIIQNGKLIGAVTHVMVSDPHKGYGILIENMLKNS